jgi:hypothetical protein
MSRDEPPEEHEPPEGPQSPEDAGDGMRPLTPGVPTAWACTGLVAGWLLDPVASTVRDTPLVISWVQPGALALVGLMVAITAWHTWQRVRVRREPMEPHQAVNRLVFGRAAALVGALVAGGYLGYAVSWLGSASEQSDTVLLRSGLAALAAASVLAGGLWLERACRAPQPPREA